MQTEPAEHEQLRSLLLVMMLTSIPTTAFCVYIGLTSASLSVVAIILDTVVAQLINLVSYFVLGMVGRSNIYLFPYGMGKLENFASFFYGCFILLVSGAIVYQGIIRLSGPPVEVSLGLAQLAVLFSLIRIALIVWWLSRIVRHCPERSPLLQAYYLNCTGILCYTVGILVAMLIGWLLAGQEGNVIAPAIDLLVAASYAVYLILSGIRVIRDNFRALLDLPLPECDQLRLLRVLTHHYDAYEDLVNIFTRYSGGRRCIEIELSFSANTTANQIEAIRSQMWDELRQHFGRLDFFLIARCIGKEPAISQEDK